MTRPLQYSDRTYSAFPRMTAVQINPMMGARRIFVMTIQGDTFGPGRPQQEYFEPDEAEISGAGRIGQEGRPSSKYDDTQILEEAQEFQTEKASDTYRVRPVRGLVVRDATGQFYESVGQRLRPLNRIARGPKGELLELLPLDGEALSFEAPNQLDTEDSEPELPARQDRAQDARPTRPSQAVMRFFRRLFVEPGVARIVTLGEFRSMLAPQCANADRLRDSHRVKILVRIYEATCRQPVAAFLNAIQKEDPSPAPLQPLTEATIARLDLAKLLPPARAPRPMRREPGIVLPFDRFFRLVLSLDPSEEVSAPVATTATEPQAKTVPPAPQQSTLRTAIPEAYTNPWEFRITRDEALYDMNRTALRQGSLRKLGRWIWQKFSGAKGLQKWQALMHGKSLDDQLWSVRPPQSAFQSKAIKDWVRSALALAGYEPQSMILEWEVFWRRKGV